jgi:hypothetical protein
MISIVKDMVFLQNLSFFGQRENSSTNKLSKNSSNQFSGSQESCSATQSPMVDRSQLLCFNCGQYGHTECHCPMAQSNTQIWDEENAVVRQLLPTLNCESPDQSLRSNNKTSGGGWLDMLHPGTWHPDSCN